MEWLLAMSLLAETAARLRDSESASVLYRLLEPYARLNVADPLEGMRGSVARYLGLLADMLERCNEASRHFEEALAVMNRWAPAPGSPTRRPTTVEPSLRAERQRLRPSCSPPPLRPTAGWVWNATPKQASCSKFSQIA